jgi:RNA polymerase subunit RPABC4/transcription elongation factor Spt4
MASLIGGSIVSDLFDSIKDGANQVLSSIDQQGHLKSVLDGLRTQWNEIDRRRRTNQLNTEIKAMREEMKRLTEALGLQVLSLYDAGKVTHPELSRLAQRINDLRDEVEARNAELEQIKAQPAPPPTQCPQCQAALPGDAEFCQKCGARVRAAQPSQPASASPAPAAASSAQPVVRLRCPKCKTIVAPGTGFCPTCGVKLKMPQSTTSAKPFCAACGAQMEVGARFCPACGRAAPGAG